MDGYWRGLGKIEKSTLKLKNKYSRFDAFKRFGITEKPEKTRPAAAAARCFAA